MFGDFVRKKRLAKGLGLREFCAALPADPSYWSKIEREVQAPPQDGEKLEQVAAVLGIKAGSADWKELMHRAEMGAGKLPQAVLDDKELLESLPLVFRAYGTGRSVSRKGLLNLAEKIRNMRQA